MNNDLQKHHKAVVHPPDFTIPYSMRTITEQLPVLSTQYANSDTSSKEGRKVNARKVGITGTRPELSAERDDEVNIFVIRSLSEQLSLSDCYQSNTK